MQCKAIKTFDNKQYGFMRAGTHFSCEPHIAHDLRKNGLIEILDDDPNQPKRTQAHAGAPLGKTASPESRPPSGFVTVGQQEDGEDKQSPLSRAVQASQSKTASTSKGNAKR